MSLEELAPTRIGRAAAWLAKHVELALAELDLSLPQYRVLSLLAEGSAVSSALADRLAVRPPSVTALIDGLVSRGLVERSHDDDDRRRIDLVLSPSGVNLLAEADRQIDERLINLADSLATPALRRRAIENLDLWGDALSARWRDRVSQ